MSTEKNQTNNNSGGCFPIIATIAAILLVLFGLSQGWSTGTIMAVFFGSLAGLVGLFFLIGGIRVFWAMELDQKIQILFIILFTIESAVLGSFLTTDSGFGIFLCAVLFGAIGLFAAIVIVAVINKFLQHVTSEKIKRAITIGCSVVVLIAMGCLVYSSRDFRSAMSEARQHSQSVKKEKKKCSLCGKYVSADDMRGNWCKDCQNDAFGKDGWYYDM